MTFFRCQICGDVYMGGARPSNCPYCGAPGRYLVPASDWTDENLTVEKLSDISRRNLEEALQLEVNNAPFYRDASAKAGSVELQGIFKCLAKIEAEHVSVVKKILKCEPPQPEAGSEMAGDDDAANIKLAREREVSATEFYRRAAGEAVEPRVRKVFTALAEVESDHIAVEEGLLGS